ncbi:hypothetical protein Poly51_49560 [Rubripirellula tenax]|uniref:Uncharacterized protein n=1 Tax=Rubripirellula tenax TaxID=2528015 RepID=A0A5C6EE95_9BACT|nr:hypothetical protein Poly51_49560 [Rubripirellula tenax]
MQTSAVFESLALQNLHRKVWKTAVISSERVGVYRDRIASVAPKYQVSALRPSVVIM